MFLTLNRTSVGTGRTVICDRAEPVIRAFAVSSVMGLAEPTEELIKWMNHMTPQYDNTVDYWLPFAQLEDGTWYTTAWARGGLAYMRDSVGWIYEDPSNWYGQHFLTSILDCSPDEYLAGAARLAYEQTSPNDQMYGSQVTAKHAAIRVAINKGQLLVDAGAIIRRRKSIVAARAARQAQMNRDLARVRGEE